MRLWNTVWHVWKHYIWLQGTRQVTCILMTQTWSWRCTTEEAFGSGNVPSPKSTKIQNTLLTALHLGHFHWMIELCLRYHVPRLRYKQTDVQTPIKVLVFNSVLCPLLCFLEYSCNYCYDVFCKWYWKLFNSFSKHQSFYMNITKARLSANMKAIRSEYNWMAVCKKRFNAAFNSISGIYLSLIKARPQLCLLSPATYLCFSVSIMGCNVIAQYFQNLHPLRIYKLNLSCSIITYHKVMRYPSTVLSFCLKKKERKKRKSETSQIHPDLPAEESRVQAAGATSLKLRSLVSKTLCGRSKYWLSAFHK